MNITDYVKSNNFQDNIQLDIGLDKVSYRCPETRYFSIFVDGVNVTPMVADALGLKLSKAKDTNGSMIIHGGGMDMCFKVQSDVYCYAYQKGFVNMFDPEKYFYLGKRINGKYVYSDLRRSPSRNYDS